MSGLVERRTVLRLNVFAWIVFLAFTVSSFIHLPFEVSLGVLIGGLLVVVNLALLQVFARRALSPGAKVKIGPVLFKYYASFLATLVVIFVLMLGGFVNQTGLLIGLSVFAIALFAVAAHLAAVIVYKTIVKEAV